MGRPKVATLCAARVSRAALTGRTQTKPTGDSSSFPVPAQWRRGGTREIRRPKQSTSVPVPVPLSPSPYPSPRARIVQRSKH
jgi:hypothetical protein